jgi:hypothetical protein
VKRVTGAVVSLATAALLLLPGLASAWDPPGSAPVHPGGDLQHELAYARSHGFPGLRLATGTEPFKPDLVGAVLGA